MKRWQYSILFALICFQLSCVKQETGDYQLEYRMKLNLPADAHPLQSHIFEKRMASYWSAFLQEKQLDAGNIKAVKPRSIILTPVFDNSISYDIISEGHVIVYPVNMINQLIPIAEVYDPVSRDDELIFLPGLADVTSIISQAEFILKLTLNVRSIPGSESEHFLTVQFDVFLN